MTLVCRYLANTGVTQLVSGSGHVYGTGANNTVDVPATDNFSGATFVGVAQYLTAVGATSERPIMTVNGLVPPITDMYDSTLAKQIHYKAGSNPATWLDQVGASV
jgi:hypothetical protein